MYLVDTSIWIDYLKDKNNASVKLLEKILDEGAPFGITSVIYQEILQGAASHKDYIHLVEYLSTMRFFHPLDPIISFQSAAKLYFDCRKQGITIRSTIDCLIAQIAVENKLVLLHADTDYQRIKKIAPDLELLSA